jgi:hypothetical protein
VSKPIDIVELAKKLAAARAGVWKAQEQWRSPADDAAFEAADHRLGLVVDEVYEIFGDGDEWPRVLIDAFGKELAALGRRNGIAVVRS